jgi:recombination protein RecA
MGLVQKSGAWYAYGDLRLGQGRENSRDYLKQNPDLADEIEGRVRGALKLGVVESTDLPEDETDA